MAAPIVQQGQPQFNTSLYVGDLADDCTEAILWDNFSKVGPVVSIKICRDSLTKKSRGYAYVNYQNPGDAEKALDHLNHSDIDTQSGTRPCRIMWSDRNQSARKSGVGNLFVKGLPLTHTSKDMEDMFSFYGAILSCKIKLDRNTNKSIGHGYVQFSDPQAAEKAIADLNGKAIQGNPITVELFKSKPERPSGEVHLKTVYCKHYPVDWSEADLHGKFVSLGVKADDIGSIWLAKNQLAADQALLGYAIVTFTTHEAAERAIAANNDTPQSYVLTANKEEPKPVLFLTAWHKRKADRAKEKKEKLEKERELGMKKKIYIIGLPEGITSGAISDHFMKILNITDKMPWVQHKPEKNQAHVMFSTPEFANRAVATPECRLFNGKDIIIKHFLPQEKRQLLANQHRQNAARVPNGNPFGFPPNQFRNNRPQGRYPSNPQFFQQQPNMYPVPQYQNNAFPPQFRQQQGVQGGARQGGMVRTQGGFNNRNPQQQRGGFPGARPQQQYFGQPNVMVGPNARNFNQGRPVQQMALPVQMPVPQQRPNGGFNIDQLHTLPPAEQQNYIGEELYAKISLSDPQRAGKITGMLLEMDVSELLHLLESPDLLKEKIDEAIEVLEKAV